jgi:asparagine synthase (glutamine-hydrolysing)
MCGIVGTFVISDKGCSFPDRIEQANERLFNRGPDGGSIFRRNRIAFGHRRLSIIDVSCAGDQPMHTADGRYTMIFNGEIFNYKELRDTYLSVEEKSSLRSNSDTEIFLLLFAKLKERTFGLLQGFFAAAIYDHEIEELFLVRDRYGKKPLLVFQDVDKIIFASEMKALFEAGIPKQIAWELLPIYLQLNYVPQPFSLVQGVKKVIPGHYWKVSKTMAEEHSYYELTVKQNLYESLSYDDAQLRLEELMDDAVKKRLISDVPLGAFLSGGIDSSVVVALASRHTQKLKTFSIGYKDNAFFDETHYAKLVADRYKTEHTVFSLGSNDFLEHVYDVLRYVDEPFGDSSALPVFILSKNTRKHVTVALSGDGADEVFAGYNKHAAEWRMRNGSLLNRIVRAGYPILSFLPKSRSNKVTNTFRQLYRFGKGARLSADDRYWQWASFTSEKEALSLLRPQLCNQIDRSVLEQTKRKYTKDIKGKDFNEVLLADMNLVLLSDMLTKVDLMSMANSLEIRSPFLDNEVVDFAFGLPSSFKVDGKMKKKIVQDAFRKYLPEELYNRPKHGFEIPLLGWLRKELWGLIDQDLLKDSFIEEQGIFNVATVQHLKRQLHSSNPEDRHATIWALVVFQFWWKHYIA